MPDTFVETVSRRGLMTGLGALFLTAPAIVRASSLMPISSRHSMFAPQVQTLEWIIKYRVELNEDGKTYDVHLVRKAAA